MTGLITPRLVPEEVRLEAGMVMARVDKHRDGTRRKLVVLVKPRTVRRPVSMFDQRPNRPMQDVTQWIVIRLYTGEEGIPAQLGPGTYMAQRERVIRKMYRFVGYLGEINGSIDWEALK